MILTLLLLLQQPAPTAQPPAAPAQAPAPAPAPPQTQRTQLNLMGQTDAASGESRRNENVQFNLIDTNTIKELNVRLGTTATIVEEFKADRGYFGGEFGNRPANPVHLAPAVPPRNGYHGSVYAAHNNSVFTARAFFQAGGVQPARENQYGFALGGALSKRWRMSLDGMQQKVRGQVNGNVLVPLPDERTPLTNDPALARIILRYMSAYKNELPNRTDIDPRALNTNSRQIINTDNGGARLDFTASSRDRVGFAYRFTSQQVKAFQLIAGQNPDTDIKSHAPRITWTRAWNPATVLNVTVGYDRSGTLIKPEPNAVGPTVSFGNAIGGLGPAPPIPIDRAVNKFRYAAAVSRVFQRHTLQFGGEVIRNQVNGLEQDGNRGILGFANDFGREAITNFRLGTPSSYVQAIGNNIRGFRYWNTMLFVDDRYKLSQNLTLHFGLRFEPMSRPKEVNKIDQIPFDCDCNNYGPRLGFAYKKWGVIRGAYGVHFGEIFATTFGQTRLSPPGSYRVFVGAPDLRNLLAGVDLANLSRLRAGIFEISPDMVTPYSHQYNFSWEPELRGGWFGRQGWKMQVGYVGSRSHKLFQMWFNNRGRNNVAGVPVTSATLNQRRADARYLEVFRLLNASRGYYDAGRVSLITPSKWKVNGDVSYWFSKAMDLGNDYTSTLAGQDARTGRSQSEDNVHGDLKAVSSFDQKHAFLMRGNIDLFKGWKLNGVFLLKQGTPFSVESGSDGPGFGNVDGQGGDRVHILDPAILGATVGDPDTSLSLLRREAFAYMRVGESRGNLGRNTFRRGKIANVNASLQKGWKMPHETSLTLRAESINLMNTPQFAEPNFNLASPSFGRITNTLNDGRTFRFQLTVGF